MRRHPAALRKSLVEPRQANARHTSTASSNSCRDTVKVCVCSQGQGGVEEFVHVQNDRPKMRRLNLRVELDFLGQEVALFV